MNAEVDPSEAAEQMRDVTDRLREQAWMVAPMTTSVPLSDVAVGLPQPVAEDTKAS